MITTRTICSLTILTVLAAPLLSGCSAVRHEAVCPTLVTYSSGEQTQLAQELAVTPSATMTHRVVRDCVGLRDQVRACQANGK